MAKRRRSLPPPPGLGGYEFEVVEPGPATYFSPPPVVKARGGLKPVGDGEGLVVRPAPPSGGRTGSIDDVAVTFEARLQLGLTRHAMKDYSSAVTLLERAVATARRASDPRMTATALHSLGLVFRDMNRPEAAIPLSQEVAALSEASGDRRMLARALTLHGSLLRHLGRYQEAAEVLERALATVGDS